MSAEEFMREPPKNRARDLVAYLAVAVVMFGAGMLLESQLAARTAASVKLAHEQELKQVADKAEQAKQETEQDKRMLADTLAKEREEHAKDIQAKDRHLAALASRAAGVRHALEADLSAARTSGEACTGRIAGISEALSGVFDSIGEVTGIAQDLGRENQQLKEDNKSLSDKLAGWQKWNTERGQRVTIVGQKRG
jgi:C4-dicarboxylate-specific signal transduction histidine kinase